MPQQVSMTGFGAACDCGRSQFEINNVGIDAGELVDMPPDHELRSDLREGEMALQLFTIDGLDVKGPVPEIDSLVEAEDLELVMNDLPADSYKSSTA